MQKIYSRINWKNFPSEETAVNETNLNRMDSGLDAIDDRVVAMDATKFDAITANSLIKDWEIDENTGIITITKLSGEKILFDLNIEKIPVSFALSDDGILTMTTDDGTKFTANIGAMIPILTFEDSDEIAVSVSGEGVNKTYSFSIKNGSITEDKLRPDYLADIKVESAKAASSAVSADRSAKDSESQAVLAKSYTVGGTGTRDGEDTDNAKYYAEQAKNVSQVDIATTEKAGIVKPDGETLTIEKDGTMHAKATATDYVCDTLSEAQEAIKSGKIEEGATVYVREGADIAPWTVDAKLSHDSVNPVQNKVIANAIDSLKGFVAKTTTFNEDGSITEVSSDGAKVTTFNDNGSITETLTDASGKSVSKTTIFNADGSITEEVSA